MEITKEWLMEKKACCSGYSWYINQDENDLEKLLYKLIDDNHPDWAIWLLSKILNDENNVKLSAAVYSTASTAKQIIEYGLSLIEK